MSLIAVIVERGLVFLGQTREPGITLEVEPLQAAELVHSGRARLANAADAPTMFAAVRSDSERVTRGWKRV